MHEVDNFDENDVLYNQYEVVDALAHDFLARHRNGERPSVDEYVRRHPSLAEQIESVFPAVLSLEKVKIGHQEAADGRATLAGHEIKQLGDFEILREIGRGGMGIVSPLDKNRWAGLLRSRFCPSKVCWTRPI